MTSVIMTSVDVMLPVLLSAACLYFKLAVCEMVEVCPAKEKLVVCGPGEIITMTSAEYGRKEVGRCITEQDEFMGCTNDVLPLLDRWCSGRRQCKLLVPNDNLSSANKNCRSFLSMYLKIAYRCTAVSKAEGKCSSSSPNLLASPEGTISSHVTDETRCGSKRSPWIIKASQGQTLILNMIDFYGDNLDSNSFVSCKRTYGFVLEKSLGINHTICGGNTRQGELYKSKTNSVEIHLIPASARRDDAKFLIEFAAVGCSDLEHPEHAWYRREGNEAVIGCDNNDQEWRLTCVENSWQGSTGNCSKNVMPAMKGKRKEEDSSTFTFASVVIMAGIIGGAVVLIVAVTMCGVIHLKKYRMKHERKRLELQKDYSTVDRMSYAYYRPQEKDVSLLYAADQNSQSTQNTLISLPGQAQNTLISLPGQAQNTLISLPGGGKVPVTMWDQTLREPLNTDVVSPGGHNHTNHNQNPFG